MMLYLLCYPSLFFLSTFYANTIEKIKAKIEEDLKNKIALEWIVYKYNRLNQQFGDFLIVT